MFAEPWRYTIGYVRGFVSGVREYRHKPPVCAPAPVPDDDPDALLEQAQIEMRENQAKNRERAVEAITAKNQLQAQVDQAQQIVSNLQAKADKAITEGNQTLADQLLTEKAAYEVSLADMTAYLASAFETVERVKVAIRRKKSGFGPKRRGRWRLRLSGGSTRFLRRLTLVLPLTKKRPCVQYGPR